MIQDLRHRFVFFFLFDLLLFIFSDIDGLDSTVGDLPNRKNQKRNKNGLQINKQTN